MTTSLKCRHALQRLTKPTRFLLRAKESEQDGGRHLWKDKKMWQLYPTRNDAFHRRKLLMVNGGKGQQPPTARHATLHRPGLGFQHSGIITSRRAAIHSFPGLLKLLLQSELSHARVNTRTVVVQILCYLWLQVLPCPTKRDVLLAHRLYAFKAQPER